KFGVVAAKDNTKAQDLAKEVASYIEGKGHDVVDEANLSEVEAVITIGGDGTLLHVSCANMELNVPFIGINEGTLGFLTAAEGKDWQEVVDHVLEGNYEVSESMTIEANLEPETRNRKFETFRALNEIVVKSAYRVVNLEVFVNGQKFLNISGDGVIISTQTGSTAYSLSSGGPIVDPQIDAILITPISAHGLPIPSVVISPENTVEVKVIAGDDVSLIIDGQQHESVSKGQSIKVSKGKSRVKLGYLDRDHFLKALNAKFGLASRLTQ
ncbi:MAG: NAD(+)/NADH kinase, partial [Candidatus Curtissbacteria bacterium]|nr:NAD(+)/NADH kinase [Candidatus Curtissbacteria bacterium]